jgi:hypothetical protein
VPVTEGANVRAINVGPAVLRSGGLCDLAWARAVGNKEEVTRHRGDWHGHDYSRLADWYPGSPDDRWWDLGLCRLVESKKTDGNPAKKLGHGDANNLWRLWHARHRPGLTPIARSSRPRLGGAP